MTQSASSRRRAGLMLLFASAIVLVVSACSTAGTPSVAQPPVTELVTVTTATTVPTTATVTATVTSTPPPTTTAAAAVLVSPTFKDASTFECADAAADSCWALDVTTSGPCPNGVYVAINVYRKGEDAVLQVLETTSTPVTDALGGTLTVQLSQTGLSPSGDPLEADLKEARCA